MDRRLALLSLILLSSCFHPATGFVPTCTPTTCGKCNIDSSASGVNNPAAGYSCSESRTCARKSAARNRSPWRYRRYKSNARRRLHVSATAAPTAGVEDTTFEPERFPGRALAPHEPRVRAFEEWAAREGCKGVTSLSHADFDGLRGLMTKGAVHPWQPIATVPASLYVEEFVSCSACSSKSVSPPAPLSAEAWQRCPWWVRLGMRLLKEKAAGEGSRLREYIGILPEEGRTGTLLNWSAEQLNRLHYPRLLSQVSLQRRLFKGADLMLSPLLMVHNRIDSRW